MLNIKYFTLVPYSAKQMFYLINDINSYSNFIPGCSISKILNKNDNDLIAELGLTVYGSMNLLITHNFFVENKSIRIFLVKGPLKSLYGRWDFTTISDSYSKIECIFYYEFSSIFIEKTLSYVFENIHRNIIQVFISRAKELYKNCNF